MSSGTRATRRAGWRRYGWFIGLVIGPLVAAGVWMATQAWQEQREADDVAARAEAFGEKQGEIVPPPGDTVRALLAQDSRVVVDPYLAGRVSEEDLARAEQVLAGAATSARLAYVRYPEVWDGFTPTGLPVQWSVGVAETGHYVVLYDNGSTQATAVALEEDFVSANGDGQPGPALERIAQEMATWEAEPLPTEPAPPNEFDYWSGVGGGLGAAALFALFVVAPLFLLLRFIVGRLRPRET